MCHHYYVSISTSRWWTRVFIRRLPIIILSVRSQQCSWPLSVGSTLDGIPLPAELRQCQAEFEAFYSAAHQGRHLQWSHAASTVDLVLRYTDRAAYTVQAPVAHAAVLLLFDALGPTDSVRLGDLQSELRLPLLPPEGGSATEVEGNWKVFGGLLDLNLLLLVQPDGTAAATLVDGQAVVDHSALSVSSFSALFITLSRRGGCRRID